jgi:hypothetical protein
MERCQAGKYSAHWNERAIPFVWTKTVEQILAKAAK